MLERSEERRSQSHLDERLPYDQQNWNRRLAEARARRAAALREREAQQGRAAPPFARLAAAWNGERDALAMVTRPIARPSAEPVAASAKEPETAAADADQAPIGAALRRPTSLRPAGTLLAGCVIGASLTGLVLLGFGANPPTDPLLASAGAVSAAASNPPLEEPAEVGALQRSDPAQAPAAGESHGDGAAPPAPAQPAAVSSVAADVTPTPPAGPASPAGMDVAVLRSDERPPADHATVAGTAPPPAPRPVRQLAVPDLINAPQVLSPTDILPPAPAAIERVVVLAPRSVSRAGREEAAALLREAGWPARDPATSPFTISSTHVRYYHREDRAGAEALAALFSAEPRDFTSYSPRPEEGMVELWLAGRAPARQPQRQTPSLARFLGRLAAALELRN